MYFILEIGIICGKKMQGKLLLNPFFVYRFYLHELSFVSFLKESSFRQKEKKSRENICEIRKLFDSDAAGRR